MVIFPLAPDQTIAQVWSNGARGEAKYVKNINSYQLLYQILATICTVEHVKIKQFHTFRARIRCSTSACSVTVRPTWTAGDNLHTTAGKSNKSLI